MPIPWAHEYNDNTASAADHAAPEKGDTMSEKKFRKVPAPTAPDKAAAPRRARKVSAKSSAHKGETMSDKELTQVIEAAVREVLAKTRKTNGKRTYRTLTRSVASVAHEQAIKTGTPNPLERVALKGRTVTIDATGLEGRIQTTSKARELLHREGHLPSQSYVRIPGLQGIMVRLVQRDGKLLTTVKATIPADDSDKWNTDTYGTRRCSVDTRDSSGTPCTVYFRDRRKNEA